MHRKIISILLVIILCGIVLLNIADLYGVFVNPNEYPFGSDFFSRYSIYTSKSIYIGFNIVSSLVFICTIYFGIKKKWWIFYTLIFIDILFVIYPILTNS